MTVQPGDKGASRRRRRRPGGQRSRDGQQPLDPNQRDPRQRSGPPGAQNRGRGRGGGAKPAAGPGAGRGRQGGPASQTRSVPRGQLPDAAIYGINPISVAISQGMLKALYYESSSTSERLTQLHAQAQDLGIATQPLSKAGWARALSADQHQGVAGLLLPLHTHYLEDVVEGAGEDSCILVLDRVQDPQNLGAILRSAAATGVDAVVLPKAGGAPISPAVHKASAGMSMKVRIVEDENLARALDYLKEKGYWAIGCDSSPGMDGSEPEDATTFEYPSKRVLVMGNEAEGLRRLVRESCDYIVRIPMAEDVESLNVSVATAVVLYLAKADLARAELEQGGDEG